MYHFPHSYALFPNNLRIPATTPTYPLSHSPAAPSPLPRILSHAPIILSHAPTYLLSRTHASSLTHLRILSHAPTHPCPLLQVDAPSLIPTQALTSTNISTELRAPTSPSPRTPPPTYTHLFPFLYVDARPLIRISSPTCTYLFDKSFKRFI